MEKIKFHKNVLMLSEAFRPDVGGLETYVEELCEYLSKKEYYVYLITYQPLVRPMRVPSREKKSNFEILRVNWFGKNMHSKLEKMPFALFLYLFPGIFQKAFIFMCTHHKNINIIHAHGLIPGVVALLLKHIFGKRAVINLHTTFRLKKQGIRALVFKHILCHFDKIFVNGQGSKQELGMIGIEFSKIDVCAQWVDSQKFQPRDKDECKKILGLEGKFLVLFVGRFHPANNIDLLLCTSGQISEEDILFLFIGNGMLEEKIAAFAKEHRNIQLAGVVDNERLPFYYSAADLSWASGIDFDFIGRTAIESLLCHTPLLLPLKIHRLGVGKKVKFDTMGEGLARGIFIPVKLEAKEVREKILFFYRRHDLLKECAKNARSYALSHHSSNNAHTIEYIYRN